MTDPARELVSAAPPVTAVGLHFAGIQLSDWVLLATLIYTVAQLILLLPRIKQTIKGWLNGKDPRK
jgi:antibiotic biosynthesis monooxygenase (ABM) superfamily enzyme